jgi:hypothetical protein
MGPFFGQGAQPESKGMKGNLSNVCGGSCDLASAQATGEANLNVKESATAQAVAASFSFKIFLFFLSMYDL